MILLDTNQTMIATLFSLFSKEELEGITESDVRRATLLGISRFNNQFKEKYGDLVLCYDIGKYWRKEVFPEYKANRKKQQKKDGINWNGIYNHFSVVREEIKQTFPWKSMFMLGVEADDIISVLVENFYDKDNILIVSSDKDFQQLQKFPNVEQYSPNKKKMIVCDDPEGFLVEHMVKGDVSDGIPNVLSDNDSIINPDKKQTIMTKKRVKEATGHYVSDKIDFDKEGVKYIDNWVRNKTMIDMESIPQEYKDKILDLWTEPKEGDNSKVFNYMVDKKLGEMTDIVI
jgi:hypothetical protein